MKPLVSVLTPIYNRAGFLPQYLATLEAQTFTDFEVVLVDDGSLDGTYELLLDYSGPLNLNYVRIPRHGYFGIRRISAEHAKGKYFALLDSDDTWAPDKLAVQVDFMKTHPTVGLVYSNMEIASHPYLCPHQPKSGLTFRELLNDDFIPISSSMFRADLYHSVGGFATDLWADDWDLFLRMAEVWKVHYLDRILVRAGLHDGRNTKRLSPLDRLRDAEKVLVRNHAPLNAVMRRRCEIFREFGRYELWLLTFLEWPWAPSGGGRVDYLKWAWRCAVGRFAYAHSRASDRFREEGLI